MQYTPPVLCTHSFQALFGRETISTVTFTLLVHPWLWLTVKGRSLPRNKAMTIVHWGVGVMLFLELLLALVLGKDVTVYDATP